MDFFQTSFLNCPKMQQKAVLGHKGGDLRFVPTVDNKIHDAKIESSVRPVLTSRLGESNPAGLE